METAGALAAALDVPAADVRDRAGLVAAVRKVMAVTRKRDATSDELRKLPPSIRAVFTGYYAARAELASAEAAFTAVNDDVLAAINKRTAAQLEHWAAFEHRIRDQRDAEARTKFDDAAASPRHASGRHDRSDRSHEPLLASVDAGTQAVLE